MRCYPDYYNSFRCISKNCKHNCCIGWEIDIDENTLSFYEKHEGELKERFKNSISYTDTPHFILGDNERCPFLNDDNLCDIITTLGEKHICEICTLHPRFHNELPDRLESGLGLCCEEACRIIITKKEKTTILCDGEYETDDEIIMLRDKVIELLQNRERTISQRVCDMLGLCDTSFEKRSLIEYAQILLSLEILDPEWKETLTNIENIKIDTESFLDYMKHREHEYEQFCVYLIYRHFANSPDMINAQLRARFTAFALDFFIKLGAYIYSLTGSFCVENQLSLMRQFSSEIEYSDENIYTLYDIL